MHIYIYIPIFIYINALPCPLGAQSQDLRRWLVILRRQRANLTPACKKYTQWIKTYTCRTHIATHCGTLYPFAVPTPGPSLIVYSSPIASIINICQVLGQSQSQTRRGQLARPPGTAAVSYLPSPLPFLTLSSPSSPLLFFLLLQSAHSFCLAFYRVQLKRCQEHSPCTSPRPLPLPLPLARCLPLVDTCSQVAA